MADKILHKRSLTTGSIPTTSSLLVGEIALNVPDGKIYIHKSGSQGQSIESAITSNSTSYIGILTLSGSLILSGSTDVNSGNVLDVATDNISFDFDSLAFSGSAEITGSLLVTGGITGSLSGNATTSTSSSFATSASFSQTASFVQTAQTASYVLNAVSSSFASTASFAQTAQTASYVLNAVSSSYSSFAISASYAVSASHEIIKEVSSSYADTASFAQSGDGIFSGSFSGSYEGDGSQLTGIVSSSYALTASYVETATPTLQQVTDQGASTTNTIVTSADITASRNISLPTNASFIRFNSAEIYGRVGGSYPGLHLASGQSANNRIWLCDLANTTGPVTMSFIGLGKISNIQTIESRANYPLIVRGGPAPNDSNDGLIFQTADASNVYQNRFEIESDTTTVDAYFTNINGLGINNPTPTAMLDVNGNINTTSHITASGNISASSFIGDGSEITGVVSSSYALTASHALNAGGGGAGFPFTGDAVITGSLVVSASATSQSLSVIGSGSTVFDVIGSVGTLFSVDDDLTGTLFSVNDISGFPVLQASASGDVFIGKSPQSLYTTAVISSTTAATTHSLCTLSTSSYDGAFFEYTAQSASNARAGNIMSTWNGSNIVYAETTTVDIGLTSDLTTEVIISGSTARLVAYGANAGYKIKTIIKAI
jgi:hypothetical protein